MDEKTLQIIRENRALGIEEVIFEGEENVKAWIVQESDEFYSAVIFAKTAGKAKSIAMDVDGFEDAIFIRLEVKRAPWMDKYYRPGKMEMDWYDPEDRIALVKDCGFYCEPIMPKECKKCPAREYCGEWEKEG